jgi:hypothetical protein
MAVSAASNTPTLHYSNAPLPPLKLRRRPPFYSSKQMDSLIRRDQPDGIGVANRPALDDLFFQRAGHSGHFAPDAPCNNWS